MYGDSLQHLLAEMEGIDLLLQAQVGKVRRLHVADEQFHGLYISDEELDRLLARPAGAPRWAGSADQQNDLQLRRSLAELDRVIADRVAQSAAQGVRLRLPQLSQACQLDAFDIGCLLICLAPELDLRYERIYAYLQDDVTKKKPSVDLMLNLLAPSFDAKVACRDQFAADAPLLHHHLLELFEEPSQSHSSLLGKYLKVDDRVSAYLLGSDGLDSRLHYCTEKVIPEDRWDDQLFDSEAKSRIEGFLARGSAQEHRVAAGQSVIHLQGPYGIGKQAIAEAVCSRHNLALLVVNLESLLTCGQDSFQRTLEWLHRESLLQPAALFFKGLDTLLTNEKKPLLDIFIQSLSRQSELIFLAGEATWEPRELPRRTAFIQVKLAPPQSSQRALIWSAALNGDHRHESPLNIQELATKFRFTGGQIQDAAGTARSLAYWRDADQGRITMRDLYEACRLHSNQALGSLARKITPSHRWNDIVLPADRLEQLREICNQLKYRDRVYGEWGFDRKLSHGKGLNALFAGPSGTGKTMAAGILAAELGLDLYRIDLSTVVSKYIGETEKNLSRIFVEAETSNAILFFDEADALFGKRSEVKDSHDRYANIEIGYLLQRMEDYSGVAILATNFRKNMDEAFVRRLQFTVEFPFPNLADRLRIWEAIWPPEAPRSRELDLEFLARRFEITGGNIRNIALSAAFLAADDTQEVGISHILRAVRREYQKMGKIAVEGEFAAEPTLV